MSAMMQYGDLLRSTWRAYRAQWQYLVPLALAAYLALATFAVFVTIAAGLIGAVSAIFILALGSIWIQGVLVKAIDDIHHGDGDPWIGTRFGAIRPSVNALSLGALVAGISVVAGFLLLIVPGLVLMTWWALLVPAVVLERRGAFSALGRSRDLIRGHGRLVFNFVIATAILTGVASHVIGRIATTLPAPEVAALVADFLGAGLIAPFAALASAILYYELRGREDSLLLQPH